MEIGHFNSVKSSEVDAADAAGMIDDRRPDRGFGRGFGSGRRLPVGGLRVRVDFGVGEDDDGREKGPATMHMTTRNAIAGPRQGPAAGHQMRTRMQVPPPPVLPRPSTLASYEYAQAHEHAHARDRNRDRERERPLPPLPENADAKSSSIDSNSNRNLDRSENRNGHRNGNKDTSRDERELERPLPPLPLFATTSTTRRVEKALGPRPTTVPTLSFTPPAPVASLAPRTRARTRARTAEADTELEYLQPDEVEEEAEMSVAFANMYGRPQREQNRDHDHDRIVRARTLSSPSSPSIPSSSSSSSASVRLASSSASVRLARFSFSSRKSKDDRDHSSIFSRPGSSGGRGKTVPLPLPLPSPLPSPLPPRPSTSTGLSTSMSGARNGNALLTPPASATVSPSVQVEGLLLATSAPASPGLHSIVPADVWTRQRQVTSHSASVSTESTATAFASTFTNEPEPDPEPEVIEPEEEEHEHKGGARESMETDDGTVRLAYAASLVGSERTQRADVSSGSWLADADSALAVDDGDDDDDREDREDEDPFDLDDYLSDSLPLSPSPSPSSPPTTTTTTTTTTVTTSSAITSTSPTPVARPSRPARVPAALAHLPARISDEFDFFGGISQNRTSITISTATVTLANLKSTSTNTAPAAAHMQSPDSQLPPSSASSPSTAASKPSSEHYADATALPPFARPRADPASFPDPYPHLPPLSSAGSSSASTRSSAYTNPGSTISGSGFSGDYSHVRVASGDDVDGVGVLAGIAGGLSSAHGTESIVELLSRASNGSSLSAGSRKSHGGYAAAHAAAAAAAVGGGGAPPSMPMSMPSVRSRMLRSARAPPPPSQLEDVQPVTQQQQPRLRSQPSYDTSWQREHEDFGTSEDDEYDYGEHQDGEGVVGEEDYEEEGHDPEPEPGSAIVVAEEGRALIVRGEGQPVSSLPIQAGITHLLVGGSSTPNSVPSFLTSALPQFSNTLLALDISANFLVSLSPALELCSCLEELNISANPLRVLPEFLAHLTSLRLLIADSTGISTLPAPFSALEKLHTLSVRRNKMHALPSWLCTLPCLESLLVDGNPFQGPWKALVEPLLAKAPMTPAYPPSTPMLPQLSATFSTTSSTTTTTTGSSSTTTTTADAETTDVSDADELTDLDDPHNVPSTTTSASITLPSTAAQNFGGHSNYDASSAGAADVSLEEDTITPASARLLERSASSPAANVTTFATSRSGTLSRTRTTPNRSFYERERLSRTTVNISVPSDSTITTTTVEEENKGPNTTTIPEILQNDAMRASPLEYSEQQPRHGELRRLRSADELRRAMQAPVVGAGESSRMAENVPAAPPSSPPRPKLPHYVTTSQASRLSELGMEGLAPPRRFATVSAQSRGPSRTSMRTPFVQSLWGTELEEESDADVDSPPRPVSRQRALTSFSRRVSEEDEPGSGSSARAGSSRREKEKKDRKWGFLKKMSMGKLKPMEGTATPPLSRPGTALGNVKAMVDAMPGRPGTASASVGPRSFSSPQAESSTVSASSSLSTFAQQQQLQLQGSASLGLNSSLSVDKLKIPTTPVTPGGAPATPSSASLLAPSSPMSRASKRRSFLAVDGPPALNIPIPSISPFLGGLSVTNGCDEQEDATRQPSPVVVESPEDVQRREEDRHREANARALRSVMAYLKDMNDLTMLSQGVGMSGSVLSMYGGVGALPLQQQMERVRRPTLSDASRVTMAASAAGETSVDSMDSASSAPSSHLRSFDSLNERSGSLNTMSIATSDSSGSGEERKGKDDRGKRVMIVREIVETERTYVKKLQELVDIYVRPAAMTVNTIGNVTSSSKETVVPASERKIVFGGLDSLFSFHKEIFLPALEAAARPLLSPNGAAADAESDGRVSLDVAMAIGRTFIAQAPFMKMYSSYINNFDNAVSRIRQWASDRSGTPASSTLSPSSSTTHLAGMAIAMSAISAPNALNDSMLSGKVNLTSSQRKRIKHYMKRCQMNPRNSQLNLESYLLLPVQRIPRYRLLLEDLTRNTPPPSDSYDDPLDRALAEISSLATNMNEGKREAESRRKLVQWQARIRGKFPSPLVQPHRRLIMDGKLRLTRIVRKQTMAFEVFDSHGDASNVAVDCLAPELTPRPLYGVLCNDLFVLCRDPSDGKDPNSPVDLWAVLRMQTMPQPTSIVHGNTLRIVDTKAILYLEAPSTSEAVTWFRAINMHVPTPKLIA